MTELLIFLGTSISLYGEDSSTHVPTSANYTVDDQDPINFLLPQPPNGVAVQNQKILETGQLPLGQHKIVITYLGNLTTGIGTVPLIFHYFIQQVGPSSTSSNIPTSTRVPSGTATTSRSSNSLPNSSANHRKPTEAITGGVIGGLVLISLLLALFFFKRIKNNRRPRALSEMSSIVPQVSPDVVNPFTSPPSNSNSTTAFLPQNHTSNGQSLPSRSILNKFSHKRGQLSPAIVSDLPPPEIVNPSTFPSSNPNSTVAFLRQYTSNDQSLLSQSIPSKFSHQRGQLSGPASGASRDGIHLNPFRPQFLVSPVFTPSVSSPLRALPLTLSESQTNHYDSTRTRVPQGASMQRSLSPQRVNFRFLQHDDSGVRIHAEDGVQVVVELPPVYSTE